MFGANKVYGKGKVIESPSLLVNSIFPTIQGEGPHAGVPAVFLRLAKCNLRCTFCDTEFEHGVGYDPEALCSAIDGHISDTGFGGRLLVITGGEPLLQDLLPFLDLFFERFGDQWWVQIETAGTVWQGNLETLVLRGYVSFVCSPKTKSVHPEIVKYCRDWKYIVASDDFDPDDGLPIKGTQPNLPDYKVYRATRVSDTIWVQPKDQQDVEKNEKNTWWAAQLAMSKNYRLSVQVHKIVGLE